jgi:acetylornithine deacetylase/succinyl-diaminopimelate desuccinylase-like protein
MTTFDPKAALAASEQIWEREILPALHDYIRIPNKSPAFDPKWREHGHMDRAVALIESWCRAQTQHVPGLQLEVVRLDGRTPLIYMELPGQGPDTVLLYGHLDKQPEMTGWREGLTRCVVLIEAGEESGSPDLPAYIEHLKARIGTPSLIVCLDSGCANYDQLWSTTSLRGMIAGNLRVQILNEGVHSGDASGIVASSFRIVRQLLSRIEDEKTGKVLLPELHTQVPPARLAQAREAARVLGPAVFDKFPFVAGAQPMQDDLAELVLNRTWRPTVSVVGVDGIPSLENAGNVLRPHTTFKLSIRIPPRVDPKAALAAVGRVLTQDPPYGAKVAFEGDKASVGWDAPALAPWLEKAVDQASRSFWDQPPMSMGEGGTIPFMGMLGEQFPEAQFLITGVLGPQSNAHGPNEFLHVPTGKRLTAAVASVLAAHHGRR